MTSGGARRRSGPMPQEGSATSDRKGYVLTALPAEGYPGPIPDWPLEQVSDRELQVWEQLWRTPQACAWSLPSERWRIPDVAMYARYAVRAEDPDCGPGVTAAWMKLRHEVGMSTDGLALMGWKVAVDEVAKKRAGRAAAKPVKSPVRRLRPPADAAPAG